MIGLALTEQGERELIKEGAYCMAMIMLGHIRSKYQLDDEGVKKNGKLLLKLGHEYRFYWEKTLSRIAKQQSA